MRKLWVWVTLAQARAGRTRIDDPKRCDGKNKKQNKNRIPFRQR